MKSQVAIKQFEIISSENPNAVALQHSGEETSYASLNALANGIARKIIEEGVNPGDIVAILLPPGLLQVASILAVHKAGAAYLPLDIRIPAQRLKTIMNDSGARLVLTNSSGNQTTTLNSESHFTSLLLSSDKIDSIQSNCDISVTSDQLAYVIYTSGSTGKPKGVMINQDNLNNFTSWYRSEFAIDMQDRGTALSGTGFDANVMEIWPILTAGACLCIVPEDIKLSPHALREYLSENKISVSWLPTALLEQLFVLNWEMRYAGRFPRIITTGGEALKSYPPADFPCDVYNLYGPTEGAVCSTYALVDKKDAAKYSLPSIGLPIANTNIYVLDEQMSQVAQGDTGELYIAGKSIAAGYLNAAELTNKVFLNNPFEDVYGDMLYKTGDLVRQCENGLLHYEGRADQQVNINGYRVEMQEIEKAIADFPAAKSVCVVQSKTKLNDLLAFIAVGQFEVAEADVREHIARLLPDYMIPAKFVFLENLPLTLNGKIDKKHLLASLPGARSEAKELNADDTPQGRLISLVSARLEIASLTTADDFFAMGGNSIDAISLLSMVETDYGVRINLKDFFDNPTINYLLSRIESASREKQPQAFSLTPCESREKAELSHSQELVWFLNSIDPKSTSYHAKGMLYMRGELNISALQWALQKVVDSNNIFRMRVISEEDILYQEILLECEAPLPMLDIQHIPQAQQHDECIRIINGDFNAPFNLEAAPLARWLLVKCAPQVHALLFVDHHLVHDGWSSNLFWGGLLDFYRYKVGARKELPVRSAFEYADFATAQRSWCLSDEAEKQKQYWVSKLTGAPTLISLPRDGERTGQRRNGASMRFQMPRAKWEQCEAFCRENGITPFMYSVSVYALILWRFSHQKDFCIGSGFANRNWYGTKSIIGMMINTIVLRIKLGGCITFYDLLLQARQTLVEAYSNQELPFEKVVEAVNPEKQLEYNPLFQAFFGFHDSPVPDFDLPGLDLQLLEGISNPASKFDLTVVVIPRKHQMGEDSPVHFIWEFNRDRLSQDVVESIIECYTKVFYEISENPHQSLEDISWYNTEKGIDQTLKLYQRSQVPASDLINSQAAESKTSDQTWMICTEHGVGLFNLLQATKNTGIEFVLAAPTVSQTELSKLSKDNIQRIITTKDIQQTLALPEAKCIFIDGQNPEQLTQLVSLLQKESPSPKSTSTRYLVSTQLEQGLAKWCLVSQEALEASAGAIVNQFNIQKSHSLAFDISLSTMQQLLGFYISSLSDTSYTFRVEDAVQGRITNTNSTNLMVFSTDEASLVESDELCSQVNTLFAFSKELNVVRPKNHCVINLFGIPESCGAAMFRTHSENSTKALSGWQLLPGITGVVLDENQGQLPEKVPGNLWLGGLALIDGYQASPALEQLRFKQFELAQNRATFVNTGIRAIYDNEGQFELFATKETYKLPTLMAEVLASVNAIEGVFDIWTDSDRELTPNQSVNIFVHLKEGFTPEMVRDVIDKSLADHSIEYNLIFSGTTASFQVDFSTSFKKNLSWWMDKLSDVPLLSCFPSDSERATNSQGQYQQFNTNCDSLSIADFSTPNKNVQSILISAINVMLYRMTEQTSNLVTCMNDEHGKVPVIITLEQEMSCEQVISCAVKQLLEAQKHSVEPYSILSETLRGSDSDKAGISSLTQITLDTSAVNSVESSSEYSANGEDLIIWFGETKGRMAFSIQYNAALYQEATIAGLCSNLESLMSAILKDNSQSVSLVSVVGERERTLQDSFNSYPQLAELEDISSSSLISLFEDIAAQHPESLALCGKNRLTYQTLNERSNRLAGLLKDNDVSVGDVVALCLDTSEEAIISIMAVLKVGAIYTAIDPQMPQARVELMTHSTNFKLALTNAEYMRLISTNIPHCIDITSEDTLSLLAAQPVSNHPGPTTASQDIAYIIFTSGSTGNPKAVPVKHTSVINLLRDFDNVNRLGNNDKGSLWTSLSFDVSVYEVFSTLLCGGALHLVPADKRLNSHEFFRWMAECDISSAYIPPFHIPYLSEWQKENQALSLKRLLVGVEPLSLTALVELRKFNSKLQIINGYGPSEACIVSTKFVVPEETSAHWKRCPIGYPVQNTQHYVLDKNLQRCPNNTIGELYIGGVGLSPGYLNNRSETESRFVVNPYAASETLYHTGDLVRYDHRGALTFIGRIDNQLKIRGLRIESGEIEQALLKQDGVQDVCVSVEKTNDHVDVLVAFLVVTGNSCLNEEQISAQLKKRLPAYMVPSIYISLSAFPLNNNNKLDRKALSALLKERENNDFIPAENETETSVIDAFSTVLKLDKISVEADFFRLGGHSLSAAQVIRRLNHINDLSLVTEDLFEYRTARQLASYITLVNLESLNVVNDATDEETEVFEF